MKKVANSVMIEVIKVPKLGNDSVKCSGIAVSCCTFWVQTSKKQPGCPSIPLNLLLSTCQAYISGSSKQQSYN